MSEQINKVLADRPQSFSSAEQAQARENIGAMASAGMSSYIPYSALEGTGSAITAISGSAVGTPESRPWMESANSLSVGWGGNEATAASQYNDGAGNWACREVRMSGLPPQQLYGFQARPQPDPSLYCINGNGAFIPAPRPYFLKLYHKTGTEHEILGSGIYPTGLSADARFDFVNLCSGISANIVTDTFHGVTADIDPGQSATMWYIASADIWTDGYNPVPV